MLCRLNHCAILETSHTAGPKWGTSNHIPCPCWNELAGVDNWTRRGIGSALLHGVEPQGRDSPAVDRIPLIDRSLNRKNRASEHKSSRSGWFLPPGQCDFFGCRGMQGNDIAFQPFHHPVIFGACPHISLQWSECIQWICTYIQLFTLSLSELLWPQLSFSFYDCYRYDYYRVSLYPYYGYCIYFDIYIYILYI